MTDTDKYEGHTCKWCGYVEDAGAWHYEECPIFDDPMMKHHIAEVKRLRMIVAKLEDARIESASMFDRPALFDAVREIYEQRLQDIHQEKREEE